MKEGHADEGELKKYAALAAAALAVLAIAAPARATAGPEVPAVFVRRRPARRNVKRVIFIAIIVAMLIPALAKAEPSSAYDGGRDGIGWNPTDIATGNFKT